MIARCVLSLSGRDRSIIHEPKHEFSASSSNAGFSLVAPVAGFVKVLADCVVMYYSSSSRVAAVLAYE